VTWFAAILLLVVAAIILITIHDVVQRKHTILRNFPVIGHFRYLLEKIGPELRQYIVTDNDEERPFSRDERRWVYTSSKRLNNYFGFGTDNDIENPPAGYPIIKQSTFPAPAVAADHDELHPVPAAKVLGAARNRKHAFRPESIVNISAMSFGSLSGPAIVALNRGARGAGCLHNTGEGGLSLHHQQGGEIIFQFGTGYFGVRDPDGAFDLARLVDLAEAHPVKAIEIKLSQGAKAGLGGMLLGAKVTPEIAAIRGIPVGQDCASPASHTAFSDIDGLLELVETIADATGRPVGIKSAVGDLGFWQDLTDRMVATGTGPDFVTVDGGEGGTGAAPLAFSDHVSLPFRHAFPRVYRTFAERDLHTGTVFVGSGKLGLPTSALQALIMGCDVLGVAREAMMSIGCIQAQICESGRCPTGVATQRPRYTRGLDPADKSVRLTNYIISLRKELLALAHACGQSHPALVGMDRIEFLEDRWRSTSAATIFGYLDPEFGLPSRTDREDIDTLMQTAQ